MDTGRLRIAVAAVVSLLLVLSGVLPIPIAASPYETSDPAPYTHQAVPAESDRFDQLVELYEFDTDDAVDSDSLPPTDRLAVERTVATEPDSDGWHRYELPVCKSGLLFCDSVSDPPETFQYGEGSPDRIFTIVAVDGQQYLLQTGIQTGGGTAQDPLSQPIETYTWLLGLLPFGFFLGVSHVIGHRINRQRVPDLLTLGGGGLFAVGVAIPYLTVTGVIEYDSIATSLFVGTLAATLLAATAVVWLTVQYAQTTVSASRRS